MVFLLDCSLLYIQVYYLSLFKLQAVYQLLVQLQSMSVLFIASYHSQGNSWQGVAEIQESQRYLIIPWLCQLLQAFHL